MPISKIKIELKICESEEAEVMDLGEDGKEIYDKDRFIHTTLYINDKRVTSPAPTKETLMDYSADGDVSSYTDFIFRSKNNRPRYLKDGEKSRYSAFTPITCSCGQAGCAGIWDGVHSFHKKDIVKWKITDPKTKKMLGAKYLSFDKKQYENEIEKIWEFLHENKDVILYEYGSKVTIKETLEFYKEKYPLVYRPEK